MGHSRDATMQWGRSIAALGALMALVVLVGVAQDGQAPRGHVGELSTSALFMDKFLHKDASGPMSPYPWRPQHHAHLMGAAREIQKKWHQTLAEYFGGYEGAAGATIKVGSPRAQDGASNHIPQFPFGQDQTVHGKLLPSASVGEESWKQTVEKMQAAELKANRETISPYERRVLAKQAAAKAAQKRASEDAEAY